MKYIISIIIFSLNIYPNQIIAQQKHDSCCLSANDIVGVWQRDTKRIGNGLGQNFEFYYDGTFVLHIGSNADDLSYVTQLKGKYRLDKNHLYFTIISMTVLEGGEINIADPGIDFSLFLITGGKLREIIEPNPKEIPNAAHITLYSKTHVKINNEVYYKIKKD